MHKGVSAFFLFRDPSKLPKQTLGGGLSASLPKEYDPLLFRYSGPFFSWKEGDWSCHDGVLPGEGSLPFPRTPSLSRNRS